MKKLLLLLAITGASYHGYAQDLAEDVVSDCRDKMMVGLKAGTNYSNVYGTKGENFQTNSILGFAGGVFINIPIAKVFGLQSEILYSQKGFQANGKLFGGDYEYTRVTKFIDIPVLMALMPSQYLSLLAGVQYSYLLSQKNVFNTGFASDLQQQAFNSDNSRKNVLCLVTGFDVNYKHFAFGARAGWDLQDNNGAGTSPTPQYKNMWYQATLGYRFNIRNVCGNDDGGTY